MYAIWHISTLRVKIIGIQNTSSLKWLESIIKKKLLNIKKNKINYTKCDLCLEDKLEKDELYYNKQDLQMAINII